MDEAGHVDVDHTYHVIIPPHSEFCCLGKTDNVLQVQLDTVTFLNGSDDTPSLKPWLQVNRLGILSWRLAYRRLFRRRQLNERRALVLPAVRGNTLCA